MIMENFSTLKRAKSSQEIQHGKALRYSAACSFRISLSVGFGERRSDRHPELGLQHYIVEFNKTMLGYSMLGIR